MKLFSQKMGKGDPLIILHGLFGQSDNWFTIGKKLSEQYEVYLLDQRNHGKSPHTTDFGYPQMAADVREFAEDHDLRNIILIGHSMGGKVSMKFALEYPMRVKKLIVADIAPKKYPISLDYIVEALKDINIRIITSRKQADELLAQRIDRKSLRNFLLKNLYRDENKNFKWRINIDAICSNLDQISEDVGQKRVYDKPALFIRGELSGYIREEDENEIKEVFPQSEIVTIPGASHWLHAEKPDQFYQKVIKFLKA